MQFRHIPTSCSTGTAGLFARPIRFSNVVIVLKLSEGQPAPRDQELTYETVMGIGMHIFWGYFLEMEDPKKANVPTIFTSIRWLPGTPLNEWFPQIQQNWLRLAGLPSFLGPCPHPWLKHGRGSADVRRRAMQFKIALWQRPYISITILR